MLRSENGKHELIERGTGDGRGIKRIIRGRGN